jgi:hypothetical protein
MTQKAVIRVIIQAWQALFLSLGRDSSFWIEIILVKTRFLNQNHNGFEQINLLQKSQYPSREETNATKPEVQGPV